VILGVLISLLAPAVMNALRTTKNAAVSAEIQGLTQALAAFKSQYGDYPPSRILVCEDGDYSAENLSTPDLKALGTRTVQYFKKFWPRMRFNTSATSLPKLTGIPGGFYDVDGSGTLSTKPYFILSGPECLVLFLGGVPQQISPGPPAVWAVTGFAKNPTNPFQTAENAASRNPPFHEFASGRLTTNLLAGTPAPFGFPGFLDSLGSYDLSDGAIPFYVYFSAYGGVGYDPGDTDFTEKDFSSGNSMVGVFVSSNSPFSIGSRTASPGAIQSPAPNPYTNTPPVSTLGGSSGNPGGINTAPTKQRVWQNAQTYQIISAGHDRVFGIGGQFVATGSAKLPWVNATSSYVADSFQTIQANADGTPVTLGSDARARESDNLANFSQGRLD
jgi:general secretion pathway protein G